MKVLNAGSSLFNVFRKLVFLAIQVESVQKMFRFGLIVEMGSLECVILGCTLLFALVFWRCVRNDCGGRADFAPMSLGDFPQPPHTVCVPREGDQHGVRYRDGACLAEIVGHHFRDGEEFHKREAEMESRRSSSAEDFGDSAWVMEQYYSGIGDEEEDNVSNYSAK